MPIIHEHAIIKGKKDMIMQLEELLRYAVKKTASDLHLMPNARPYIRIDGDLLPIPDTNTLLAEQLKQIALSIMTKEQQQVFHTHLSLDLSLHLKELGIFRVSIFHERNGIACVF